MNVLQHLHYIQIHLILQRLSEQIQRKEPDEPPEEIDLNSSQQAKGGLSNSERIRINQKILQDEIIIGYRRYVSVKSNIKTSNELQCCSSTSELIESLQKLLEFMQWSVPIGYEVLLEVQRLAEFYLYQLLTNIINQESLDNLMKSPIVLLGQGDNEIDKKLNQLAQQHDQLIYQLPFSQLKKMMIKSVDCFSEGNIIRNRIGDKKKVVQSQKEVTSVFLCGITCNQQDKRKEWANIGDTRSTVNKSVMHLRQQVDIMEGLFLVDTYFEMNEGMMVQQLSELEGEENAHRFVRRVFIDETSKCLKEAHAFIIREYCEQSLERARLFDSFSSIEWAKTVNNPNDSIMPTYIEKSLRFLKDFVAIETSSLSKDSQNIAHRFIFSSWTSCFLKHISKVKTFSQIGRSLLLKHYNLFAKHADHILFLPKSLSDSVVKFIEIWHTTSPQQLFQYCLTIQDSVELSHTLTLILQCNKNCTLNFNQLNTLYNTYSQFCNRLS